MKRNEILSRLGFNVPKEKQIRVIVSSDVKNEADDAFAVLHHIMTPSFDVRGIIAAHFEGRFIEWEKQAQGLPEEVRKAVAESTEFFQGKGTSMQQSFDELIKIMKICDIDDILLCHGCDAPLASPDEAPQSEGTRLIIEEAQKEDTRPLYVLLQGNLTDLASALNQCPGIADKLTAVWIGGGPYPEGGAEFNLMQDLAAARKVMASAVPLWQIPANVYSEVEVTFAELAFRVRPCGRAGRYLYDALMDMNEILSRFQGIGRNGENWCLGDQPTAGVLLQNRDRVCFHTQKAPFITEDWKYDCDPTGREIRVYDSIDTRLLMEDFYAKLSLCFGMEK